LMSRAGIGCDCTVRNLRRKVLGPAWPGLSALNSQLARWKAIAMSVSHGFKRIFLATDGSKQSDPALLAALALAHASSARVRVVQVWNLELHHHHGHWDAEVRSEAQRLVENAVGQFQAAGVLADSEILRADDDHVASAIVAAARNFSADLVVVGSRDASDWPAMLNHSGGNRLPCALDCPALIVRDRPAAQRQSQRVLLALAGGDDIAPSVHAAVAAAAAPESAVLVLHVAQTISELEGFMFDEAAETEAAMSRAIRLVSEAGVAVESLVANGRPAAETIVETANRWNADIVVIGSSRMSDIASMVLGSVSHHLLRTTGRRVLIAQGMRP
jgi:nucleotide-binding universal stress UspA family protein